MYPRQKLSSTEPVPQTLRPLSKTVPSVAEATGREGGATGTSYGGKTTASELERMIGVRDPEKVERGKTLESRKRGLGTIGLLNDKLAGMKTMASLPEVRRSKTFSVSSDDLGGDWFPESYDDVDTMLEESVWLGTVVVGQIKKMLVKKLQLVRWAAAAAWSGKEEISGWREAVCPVPLRDIDIERRVFRNRYVRERQMIVSKYQIYLRDLKGLNVSSSGHKKEVLTEIQHRILCEWLFSNFQSPYPTFPEKIVLQCQTELSVTQISVWFNYAREWFWKPMIELTTGEEMLREIVVPEDDEVNDMPAHPQRQVRSGGKFWSILPKGGERSLKGGATSATVVAGPYTQQRSQGLLVWPPLQSVRNLRNCQRDTPNPLQNRPILRHATPFQTSEGGHRVERYPWRPPGIPESSLQQPVAGSYGLSMLFTQPQQAVATPGGSMQGFGQHALQKEQFMTQQYLMLQQQNQARVATKMAPGTGSVIHSFAQHGARQIYAARSGFAHPANVRPRPLLPQGSILAIGSTNKRQSDGKAVEDAKSRRWARAKKIHQKRSGRQGGISTAPSSKFNADRPPSRVRKTRRKGKVGRRAPTGKTSATLEPHGVYLGNNTDGRDLKGVLTQSLPSSIGISQLLEIQKQRDNVYQGIWNHDILQEGQPLQNSSPRVQSQQQSDRHNTSILHDGKQSSANLSAMQPNSFGSRVGCEAGNSIGAPEAVPNPAYGVLSGLYEQRSARRLAGVNSRNFGDIIPDHSRIETQGRQGARSTSTPNEQQPQNAPQSFDSHRLSQEQLNRPVSRISELG